MDLIELQAFFTERLREYSVGADAGHDVSHAERVWTNARKLVRKQGQGDLRILVAACFLHDLVNLPKDHPQRSSASRQSADAARALVQEAEFAEVEMEAVHHAILAHSFSAQVEPESIEAKVLQDADRLEALGALGIARTFYTAGRLDSELFCAEDPFATNRPLDDKRFAVDHFAAKLLGLAQTMRTEAGRELAAERLAPMTSFLLALGEELGEPCGWLEASSAT